MNKVKYLLLCAIALCAFATSISSAAAALEFKSSKSPETVKAKGGEQVFTVGEFAVVCTAVEIEDKSQTFPTGQLKDEAKFTGCKIPKLKVSAEVKCPGNVFNFHIEGSVTVEEKGCTITAAGGICTITIPAPQGPLTVVVYTNSAGTVIVKVSIKEQIKYTATSLCGIGKEGANGSYVGGATAVGANGATLEA